jgi:hypothetical protein
MKKPPEEKEGYGTSKSNDDTDEQISHSGTEQSASEQSDNNGAEQKDETARDGQEHKIGGHGFTRSHQASSRSA